MDILPSNTPESSPEKEYSTPVALEREREGNPVRPLPRLVLLAIVALVFGFLGGRFSQVVSKPGATPAEKISDFLSPSTSGTSSEEQATISVVEKSSPAVVSIVISKDVPKMRQFGGFPFFMDPFNEGSGDVSDGTTGKQKVGSGSGFLVSSDGLIVTNKHVVNDASAEYMVITNDAVEHSAKVLALDPVNDIAVIQIEGSNFPALSFGDSDKLRVGQTAIAIGNPLGQFANSVSRGIISGLARNVTAGSSSSGLTEELSDIIQTDAAINPGNSGGPLLDLSGKVIGVNVAVAAGAENIGFAIPVSSVKRAVEQVKTTGKITAPYIGVRYVIMSEALAKQNNLSVNHGALILRGNTMTDFAVIPGSPADKAGLVENDIILEIDGQKIDENHSLAQIISKKNVGDAVKLKVWHKGETKDVSLKLEERKL